MIRSLKDLLIEADKFLAPAEGVVKEASFKDGLSSEISSLAESCLTASEVISEGAVKTAAADDLEYERLALAANRVHAHMHAQELVKCAEFEALSSESGYTQYQIEEALSKVAAKKIKDILPILVSVEGYGAPKSSHGERRTKAHAKQLPNKDKLKDASRAVGE